MPFCQRCGLALMFDDLPPTAAVVSTKANFTLLNRHGGSGIADSRKVVIEGVLEPHTVEDHDPPAPVVLIGLLRPAGIAAAGDAIETILQRAAKVARSEPPRCLALVEVAEHG